MLQRLKPMNTWGTTTLKKVDKKSIEGGFFLFSQKENKEKRKKLKKSLAMNGFFCYYIMVLLKQRLAMIQEVATRLVALPRNPCWFS